MSDQVITKEVDDNPIADKDLKDCWYCRHYRMAALARNEDGDVVIRCWSQRPPVRRVVFDSGIVFASEDERAEAKPHHNCPHYRPPVGT